VCEAPRSDEALSVASECWRAQYITWRTV